MKLTDTRDKAVNSTIAKKSPLRCVEAFIREPLTVGSFWPSSAALAQAVVESCDFKPDGTVVELGPGTGAFTEPLLQRLHQRGRLLALEISATNIELLRRRFPRCRVIHDSAENLASHLGGGKADCIISGLAWGNMLPAAQDRRMNYPCPKRPAIRYRRLSRSHERAFKRFFFSKSLLHSTSGYALFP